MRWRFSLLGVAGWLVVMWSCAREPKAAQKGTSSPGVEIRYPHGGGRVILFSGRRKAMWRRLPASGLDTSGVEITIAYRERMQQTDSVWVLETPEVLSETLWYEPLPFSPSSCESGVEIPILVASTAAWDAPLRIAAQARFWKGAWGGWRDLPPVGVLNFADRCVLERPLQTGQGMGVVCWFSLGHGFDAESVQIRLFITGSPTRTVRVAPGRWGFYQRTSRQPWTDLAWDVQFESVIQETARISMNLQVRAQVCTENPIRVHGEAILNDTDTLWRDSTRIWASPRVLFGPVWDTLMTLWPAGTLRIPYSGALRLHARTSGAEAVWTWPPDSPQMVVVDTLATWILPDTGSSAHPVQSKAWDLRGNRVLYERTYLGYPVDSSVLYVYDLSSGAWHRLVNLREVGGQTVVVQGAALDEEGILLLRVGPPNTFPQNGLWLLDSTGTVLARWVLNSLSTPSCGFDFLPLFDLPGPRRWGSVERACDGTHTLVIWEGRLENGSWRWSPVDTLPDPTPNPLGFFALRAVFLPPTGAWVMTAGSSWEVWGRILYVDGNHTARYGRTPVFFEAMEPAGEQMFRAVFHRLQEGRGWLVRVRITP